jgi:hypothetical protein
MLRDLDFVGYRYVCFTATSELPALYGANGLCKVSRGPNVLCHLRDIPTAIDDFDPKDWTS